jgi:S1-C subfamily serine protease
VVEVEAGSPAEAAGLKPGDVMLEVDGGAATAASLSQALLARKAGETLRLRIAREGVESSVAAVLAPNVARTWRISEPADATARQSGIRSDWLRTP